MRHGFVDLVNHVQVRVAQRHAHYRLTAGFGVRVATWHAVPAPLFT
jgi:hypothetical protein